MHTCSGGSQEKACSLSSTIGLARMFPESSYCQRAIWWMYHIPQVLGFSLSKHHTVHPEHSRETTSRTVCVIWPHEQAFGNRPIDRTDGAADQQAEGAGEGQHQVRDAGAAVGSCNRTWHVGQFKRAAICRRSTLHTIQLPIRRCQKSFAGSSKFAIALRMAGLRRGACLSCASYTACRVATRDHRGRPSRDLQNALLHRVSAHVGKHGHLLANALLAGCVFGVAWKQLQQKYSYERDIAQQDEKLSAARSEKLRWDAP